MIIVIIGPRVNYQFAVTILLLAIM